MQGIIIILVFIWAISKALRIFHILAQNFSFVSKNLGKKTLRHVFSHINCIDSMIYKTFLIHIYIVKGYLQRLKQQQQIVATKIAPQTTIPIAITSILHLCKNLYMYTYFGGGLWCYKICFINDSIVCK